MTPETPAYVFGYGDMAAGDVARMRLDTAARLPYLSYRYRSLPDQRKNSRTPSCYPGPNRAAYPAGGWCLARRGFPYLLAPRRFFLTPFQPGATGSPESKRDDDHRGSSNPPPEASVGLRHGRAWTLESPNCRVVKPVPEASDLAITNRGQAYSRQTHGPHGDPMGCWGYAIHPHEAAA